MAPTVTLVANGPTATAKDSVIIPYNTSESLSWSSQNATSCYLVASPASSDWAGNVPTSGTRSTGNLTESKTYAVHCSNGEVWKTARFDVRVEPANVSCVTTGGTTTCTTSPVTTPKVTLTVNGSTGITSAAAGSSLNLNWTSTGVTRCYPQGMWSGSIGTSGSLTLVAPSSSVGTGYIYIVSCDTTSGTGIQSQVQVNVAPSTTSAVSRVEILGTPTLSIGYSSKDGQEALIAKATVKITAGASGFKLYKYGAFDSTTEAFLVKLNNAQNANGSEVNPTYYKTSGDTVDSGTYWLIPAGQTATYNLDANLSSPKALFAGSYNATFSVYRPAGGSGVASAVISNNTTNSVTVVGETAPYISSVTQPTSSGLYIDQLQIRGIRFDSTYNQVTINGMTRTFSTGASDVGPMIFVKPSDFGIVYSGGRYLVVVSTTKGASNNAYVNIVAVPPVSATPTVEILSTPTLSIGYSPTTGREILIAKATVKIAAGASDFKLYKNGAFDSTTDAFKATLNNAQNANGSETNPTYYKTGGYAVDNGTYWTIPVGQTATFNLEANLPETRALFAGSYNATFSMYRPAGGSPAVAYIANGTTNSVTIVGETAPYLTGIVSSVGSTTNSYTIKGIRFNASLLSVTINGKTLALPPANGTEVPFNPSDFGITTSGNYVIQVNHSTEGMSNSISANISICTTEGNTTTCY